MTAAFSGVECKEVENENRSLRAGSTSPSMYASPSARAGLSKSRLIAPWVLIATAGKGPSPVPNSRIRPSGNVTVKVPIFTNRESAFSNSIG